MAPVDLDRTDLGIARGYRYPEQRSVAGAHELLEFCGICCRVVDQDLCHLPGRLGGSLDKLDVVGVELLGDRLGRREQSAAVLRSCEECDHALEAVLAWVREGGGEGDGARLGCVGRRVGPRLAGPRDGVALAEADVEVREADEVRRAVSIPSAHTLRPAVAAVARRRTRSATRG